jgi:hypothetical protein
LTGVVDDLVVPVLQQDDLLLILQMDDQLIIEKIHSF